MLSGNELARGVILLDKLQPFLVLLGVVLHHVRVNAAQRLRTLLESADIAYLTPVVDLPASKHHVHLSGEVPLP